MSIVNGRIAGTFCWPELYTTDQVGAKAFYAKLFGWEVRDIPMGPDAAYTIFTLNGHDAAACYGAMPDMAGQGIPPHWISYVAVASSDDAAAKAKAAGGTILKEPFDVPRIGRMAVFQDPRGAVLCVWQAKGHEGIGVERERGALQWTELITDDIESSAAFYEKVFGWTRQPWPSADDPKYHLFKLADTMVAGMTPIIPEMGAIEPMWVVYFNVDSCDGAVARAHIAGGHVAVPPEKVPDVGTYAFIADPAGAHFGVLQPE